MLHLNQLCKVFSLNSLRTPEVGLAACIGGILGPFIDIFYGSGREVALTVLALLIIADWITGVAAAKKHDVFSSDYGRTVGTLRTAFMLLLPAIGNWLDKLHQEMTTMPGIFFYLLTFPLIYYTWESMTANTYRAGWGKMIPKYVISFVSSEIKAKTERATKMQGGKK